MTADRTAFLYCHGIPGSAAELDLFGDTNNSARIHCLDRVVAAARGPQWIDHLAGQALSIADGGAVRLIGFSLGSHAALQIAARLGSQLSSIDLIAPAAPLEIGDFLPGMAGGTVFRVARDRPRFFHAMVRAQSLFAKIAPRALTRVLLGSAVAADRTLADDPVFRRRLGDILQTSLGAGRQAYRQEISAYARPWAHILPTVEAPVTLWHGRSDNWSPPAMSDALVARLPQVTEIRWLEGLSHYSALRAALPQILDR